MFCATENGSLVLMLLINTIFESRGNVFIGTPESIELSEALSAASRQQHPPLVELSKSRANMKFVLPDCIS